jgi:hypothetical protein
VNLVWTLFNSRTPRSFAGVNQATRSCPHSCDPRSFPPKECAGVRLSAPRPSPAAGGFRLAPAASAAAGKAPFGQSRLREARRSGRRSPSPAAGGRASPLRTTLSNRFHSSCLCPIIHAAFMPSIRSARALVSLCANERLLTASVHQGYDVTLFAADSGPREEVGLRGILSFHFAHRRHLFLLSTCSTPYHYLLFQ